MALFWQVCSSSGRCLFYGAHKSGELVSVYGVGEKPVMMNKKKRFQKRSITTNSEQKVNFAEASRLHFLMILISFREVVTHDYIATKIGKFWHYSAVK